ncbi:MAG TPA: class I SAM-dependent methyltransferase [Candidatus Limnocylindrales bacterium]|nr:class I SAM-dependent methyltransferase [Candidatus Limnocylindrales bacterium]
MSFFDTAYEGRPPWDLGRPQPAIVELAEAGRIVGSVLDVGCGTGEHALYLAERGHDVVGVDLAPRAIELARAKAAERGVRVDLRIWDALRVDELSRRFDTAIDVGLFHTLSDEQRPGYARSLHAALTPAGRALILCWSERNPWGYGPRRVTQMELLGTFVRGWVVRVRSSHLESRLEGPTIHAWLCELGRTGARAG